MFKRNYHIETDESLMQRSCAGDARAFEALYDRYGPRMYRFFYRMLRQDARRAEDLSQDLFTRIFEKGQGFNPEKRFSTWLYTIAYNLCKNEFRRREPLYTEDVTQYFSEEPFEFIPETLDLGRLENDLRQAIDSLEERHRRCFILRYQEERSIREISEITGDPEGTIKSRLHYALKKLAIQLEPWRT